MSATSINSSSWLGLANGLLWSFVSEDDPTPPLSFEGVVGVSLSTDDSGLFCTGGLNLSLSIDDAVISSWRNKSVCFFDSGEGSNLLCPRRDLQSIAGYGEESD